MPPQIGGDVLGGSPLGGAREDESTSITRDVSAGIDAAAEMAATIWRVRITDPESINIILRSGADSNRAVEVVVGNGIGWVPNLGECLVQAQQELGVWLGDIGEFIVTMPEEVGVW